jgi:hypothetical protein
MLDWKEKRIEKTYSVLVKLKGNFMVCILSSSSVIFSRLLTALVSGQIVTAGNGICQKDNQNWDKTKMGFKHYLSH